MERITSYKQLMVYQKAFQCAADLHRISLSFPKIEQYALASQLRRATTSICANIAGGHAKKMLSVPEFRRYLSVAFGSSEEVKVWLDFCLTHQYIEKVTHEKYYEEYEQISKMLRSLISKWSKN